MKNVIKVITDVITIVGPAASSVLVALGMAEVIEVFNTWYGITLLVLGALSSVASIVYNAVTEVKVKE